jgi:hypothetical protein
MTWNCNVRVAQEAALSLVNLLGPDLFEVDLHRGEYIIITEKPREGMSARVLKLECGNMMHVQNIHCADIIMLETDISQVSFSRPDTITSPSLIPSTRPV